MGIKNLKSTYDHVIAAAILLLSTQAQAVTVTPVNAGSTDTTVTPNIAYFPLKSSGVFAGCSNAGQIKYPPSLTLIDPVTAGSDVLYFDITATSDLADISSTETDVVIKVQASDYTNLVLVPVSNPTTGQTNEISYGTTEGATVRFGISLTGTHGSATNICTKIGSNTNCQYASGASVAMSDVYIGLIKAGQTFSGTYSGGTADKTQIGLRMSVCGPRTSSTATNTTELTQNFRAEIGDGEVNIINESSLPYDDIPVSSLIIMASETTTNPNISSQIVNQHVGSTGSSTNKVTGLTNDVRYCFALGYKNAAGLVSYPTQSTSTCATPSQIDGFLNRNTCFIASAAYKNDWDSRLKLLRSFRDKVLLRTSAGKAFTDWYYGWSPKAAKFIWDKPALRSLVRGVLMPLIFTAKIALFAVEMPALFAVALVTVLALAIAFGLAFRKKRFTRASLALVALLAIGFVANSAQASTPAGSQMKDPNVVQPYIESLKAGKKLEPKYRKTVSHASGFAIVTSNTFDVNSTKAKANNFNSVYKTNEKYSIGIDIFYEYQFLRDKNWGSLGPVAHLTILNAKGKGIFTKLGRDSNNVNLRMIALPVTAGVSYRFTMARFFQPFAQIGVTAVPFMETRDDGKPSRRALSSAFTYFYGANISLDWVHRKSAWDLYDSNGILHTYLTLQKMHMTHMGGNVGFNYDAFYAGLTFEI